MVACPVLSAHRTVDARLDQLLFELRAQEKMVKAQTCVALSSLPSCNPRMCTWARRDAEAQSVRPALFEKAW
jgi:hypothetical protein